MSLLLTSAETVMQRGLASRPHIIPPITDPMGKHWDQPNRFNIEVDATHAMMSKQTFEGLATYSCTTPTGVYPGKMWKALRGMKWWLCWFDVDPEPNYCSNHYREILVIYEA